MNIIVLEIFNYSEINIKDVETRRVRLEEPNDFWNRYIQTNQIVPNFYKKKETHSMRYKEIIKELNS